MQYYISWTHSDPVYHYYMGTLGVLVSPPNVSLAWKLDNWSRLPDSLILDSGAFQFRARKDPPSTREVLDHQIRIIGQHTLPVAICSLDIPLQGASSQIELDDRVNRTLDNAMWLIDLHSRGELPGHIEPIGVIQGYNAERVYQVARTLEDMGYKRFALGSLATLSAAKRDEVLRRVEAGLEAVGPNLHILGVSSVPVLAELARMGVRSADSGTPMHEAWRGGLFYSRPFRRYKLANPHFAEWRRTYSFAELLDAPLACDCSVCNEDPGQLTHPKGKKYVNLRALHNCYHLARELDPSLP